MRFDPWGDKFPKIVKTTPYKAVRHSLCGGALKAEHFVSNTVLYKRSGHTDGRIIENNCSRLG